VDVRGVGIHRLGVAGECNYSSLGDYSSFRNDICVLSIGIRNDCSLGWLGSRADIPRVMPWSA